MKPERVLILHDYAGSRGGAEIITLDFRSGLRKRGMDARLMTTRADGVAFTEAEAPDYTCAGSAGRLRVLPETYNPSAASALARVLREFRPDIVHLSMFMTALSPAILGVLRRVPVVHALHTYREICPTGLRWRATGGLCTAMVGNACHVNGCFSGLGVLPRRLQMAIMERGKDAIDRSVAPSHAMAEILRTHGWPVTDVVPHGVPDPPSSAGSIDPQPLIAFAGRLTEEKGVGWLLDAVAHAGDRLGSATVEIIGDGPLRTDIATRIAELGLGGRVLLRGRLPRAESQCRLSRAWVQIVPSLWPEPFGLVTAEALMRGTAVIASDQGAQPEIVRHGDTGWIVRAGDVSGLADSLVDAVTSRERVQQMGARAVEDARKRFTMDRCIDSYVDIYEEVLEHRARTGKPVDGMSSP